MKWGTLVHLARRESIKQIIQVAFLRRGSRFHLETGRGEVAIADEVWEHFRNVESVKCLEKSTELDIQVIAQPFNLSRRQEYIGGVTNILRQREDQNKVVLLDPDTGIEPRRAGAQHVKEDEIHQVWQALIDGDWLVVYQHGSRRMDWRDTKKRQFEHACLGLEMEVFESRRIASDVVLFAAGK